MAKAAHGARPKKQRFGGWMWPVLGVLARCRGLRGTPFDPFGRTAERRMERALADDYAITMTRAFAALKAGQGGNAQAVAALAALPAKVRGYGPVKLASVAAMKRAEPALALQAGVEAATGAQAIEPIKGAGALRGIPVVVAAK
ncbi:MAG: hypothetical protein GAK41_00967 [Burkholderia gladioli]|nr:MAG: hypothetical protein GAK41_00967 [Burkholderia gladioli]